MKKTKKNNNANNVATLTEVFEGYKTRKQRFFSDPLSEQIIAEQKVKQEKAKQEQRVKEKTKILNIFNKIYPKNVPATLGSIYVPPGLSMTDKKRLMEKVKNLPNDNEIKKIVDKIVVSSNKINFNDLTDLEQAIDTYNLI